MKYGLIGEKLSHSFSKEIHEKLSHQDYEIVEVPKTGLASFMKKRDFCGINVTIPYKETVMKYLDVIDDHAKMIGAVNTVINRGGKLYGYNTDFEGFCGLAIHAGIELKDKKVLILGNGGTAKTAAAVCESLGVNKIYIATRKPGAANISKDDYKDYLDAEVLVNATPVGMYPDIHNKPADIADFKNLCGVIDAVYNPIRTELVNDAIRAGIPAECGLYMLVRQAVAAEELFTGEKIKYNLNEQVYKEILFAKENIVLIGMPGCGKSTVGNVLAKKTGRRFIDIDSIIEEKYGSPSSIIINKGESAFRDIEQSIIADISAQTGCVIATGGGAILREQNMYSLKSNGKIFFIDRSLDLISLTGDHPLTPDAKSLSRVYTMRYKDYKKFADIVVDGDSTFADVADNIMSKFKRGVSSGLAKILVLNGPNLNMLGVREPEIYGTETYSDLCERIKKYSEEKGFKVELFQSNHEGALVDKIQESMGIVDGMVINAGGYAHTSIAIPDAVRAVGIPVVEVHISDVSSREEFRKTDYLKDVAFDIVSGKGTDGYFEAIDKLLLKIG